MISSIFGSSILACLIVCGIIGAVWLIVRLIHKDLLSKICLFILITVFYYTILIPLVVGALPTIKQDPYIQLGISYVLSQYGWQYSLLYNFIMSNQVIISASSFGEELGAFLEVIYPLFFIIKFVVKRNKPRR